MVRLFIALLATAAAWVAPRSPSLARHRVAVRADPGGGAEAAKKSLADAIAAFSKGKLSREELESVVRAEEAAAAAQLARERAARDAAKQAAKQKTAIGAGSVLGALGLVAGGVLEVETALEIGAALPLAAAAFLGVGGYAVASGDDELAETLRSTVGGRSATRRARRGR
ncbi:hypothetical protein SO694_00013044 [Aureococcus anophagefferens]|uniref:Uncharacterized protein n=1 Tax=Aureococcus anophagefferens TaxID=44056 RepID=A0ABR1G1I9_AURAN